MIIFSLDYHNNIKLITKPILFFKIKLFNLKQKIMIRIKNTGDVKVTYKQNYI